MHDAFHGTIVPVTGASSGIGLAAARKLALQSEKSHNVTSAFRSKPENVIFTVDLAKRFADTSVSVNCMSPGPGAD